MKRRGSFVLIAIGTILQSCQMAGQAGRAIPAGTMVLETEVRRLDMEQARVAQSGNVDAMSALLHPQYTAHLANGQLSNRTQTLTFVASGLLAKERFERTQELVKVSGNTAFVMGLDRLEAPPPLARRGERSRRYTNIYAKHQGRWKLFARHFHLLP